MGPDDEVCICYHVSLRKLVNFARRERPTHPSQMSQCLGAGTGCGWCIPFLTRIASDPDVQQRLQTQIESGDYAAARERYRASGRKNTFSKGEADGPAGGAAEKSEP